MQRLGLAAMILGLSSCLGVEPQKPLEGVKIVPLEVGVPLPYRDFSDKHLEALTSWYTQSQALTAPTNNPLEYIVGLFIDEHVVGYGYVLDDCGLVLTSYHIVKKLKRYHNAVAFHFENNQCLLYQTNLYDEEQDWMVCVADAFYDAQPHPLWFGDDTSFDVGTPVHFYTTFYDSDTNLQLWEPHDLGAIVSEEDGVQRVADFGDGYIQKTEEELNGFLDLGYFFISNNILFGYSGSPVFGDDGAFLGLVQQTITKEVPVHPLSGGGEYNLRMENFGLVGSSLHILEHVGDYVRERGQYNKKF
jgi:hypothetical protein